MRQKPPSSRGASAPFTPSPYTSASVYSPYPYYSPNVADYEYYQAHSTSSQLYHEPESGAWETSAAYSSHVPYMQPQPTGRPNVSDSFVELSPACHGVVSFSCSFMMFRGLPLGVL